jgi:hypothetical protein
MDGNALAPAVHRARHCSGEKPCGPTRAGHVVEQRATFSLAIAAETRQRPSR